MQYLIRLAVEEGRKMLAEREFRLSPNFACAEVVHQLALDNSSVLAWVESVGLTTSDLHMQRRQTVYDHYVAWCKASTLKNVSLSRFSDELKSKFVGLDCMTVRADRYEETQQGRLVCMRRSAQYGAYVMTDLYASERGDHVTYVEVIGRKETIASTTEDNNYGSRATYRVQMVSLGVMPESALPKEPGSPKVPKAWWDNIERFEP